MINNKIPNIGISESLVKMVYEKDNFIIEYNNILENNVCAIYFSSSNIYYPTTDEKFQEAFVDADRFEWYNTRIPHAAKHIFVRDIAKQFYIYGINDKISTMQSLVSFLEKETEGCEVITVGSSAGGYAASLIGLLLNAKTVYCFSGYFDLTLPEVIHKWIGLEKNMCTCGDYYKTLEVTKNNQNTKVFYFYPRNNHEDYVQYQVVKDDVRFHCIGLNNSLHGICIGKFNLKSLFMADVDTLLRIENDATLFSVTKMLNGNKMSLHNVWLCVKFNTARIISKIKNLKF